MKVPGDSAPTSLNTPNPLDTRGSVQGGYGSFYINAGVGQLTRISTRCQGRWRLSIVMTGYAHGVTPAFRVRSGGESRLTVSISPYERAYPSLGAWGQNGEEHIMINCPAGNVTAISVRSMASLIIQQVVNVPPAHQFVRVSATNVPGSGSAIPMAPADINHCPCAAVPDVSPYQSCQLQFPSLYDPSNPNIYVEPDTSAALAFVRRTYAMYSALYVFEGQGDVAELINETTSPLKGTWQVQDLSKTPE